jgi:hypothetical protein
MHHLRIITLEFAPRIRPLFWTAMVLIGLMVLGCQEVVRPKIPEKIIKEEVMVDLLVDAYLGNAARSNNNRVLRLGGVQLDSVLYARYEVDSLQFAENTAYYSAQIDTYLRILERVEQKLSTVKKSLDSLALIDAEQQKLDKKAYLDSINLKRLPRSLVPSISQ